MNRALHAELLKLRRRGTLVAIAAVAAMGMLASVLAFALAEDTARPLDGPGEGFAMTLVRLAGPDGPSVGFAAGMTFVGLLVFVVFTANVTNEYGQGTLRTLLLQHPRRAAWLAGKLTAMFVMMAVALLVALALSVAAAVVMAQLRGVETSQWWSGAALETAAANFLNALLATMCFALVATALGVLTRFTVLALSIGIAWMLPIEHIIQQTWDGATRTFPGLVFDAVARGGLPDASYGPALALAAGYAGVAAILAAVTLTRRDVTA
ncbi:MULTISPECIES: ABC transporter permease [Protofrankia]|uniref:Putative ABC transporter integral membrane protein n=1 Tax=Candidatus Protofrankia datiscae TaxID=2716812 RepID=F8B1C2_9ACTN|nr:MULTISPECIES: ABC transporter permease [Protofrankia]AEH09791.1 putative ABC transporter integral membrane protein [Candidatus Protofrankia datiscae]